MLHLVPRPSEQALPVGLASDFVWYYKNNALSICSWCLDWHCASIRRINDKTLFLLLDNQASTKLWPLTQGFNHLLFWNSLHCLSAILTVLFISLSITTSLDCDKLIEPTTSRNDAEVIKLSFGKAWRICTNGILALLQTADDKKPFAN